MIFNLSLLILLLIQPITFYTDFEERQPSLAAKSSEPEINNSWNDLLSRFVDEAGNVNYKAFKAEEEALDKYLDKLAMEAPSESAGRTEKLVYYINLYNAATVKLILDNYPVKSIKDINSPWDKKWVRVGEKTLSLGAIEHKILRKMDEPRIHFAINCASYSCPKLLNIAFTEDNLEQELERATREFVNDPTRNRISKESAELSEIFKWYKSDFTEHGSLSDYINRYSEIPIAKGTKLKYIKYDWSLNEVK